MKIFITWSGPRSRAVAEVLRTWIKSVLQASQPWISTHDLTSGSPWREQLTKELADTANGIVCVTKANREAPWLLFEAGAIAKFKDSHTCTLLIDLKSTDVREPLAGFQHTTPDKPSLRKLFWDFNVRLPEPGKLDDKTFENVFEGLWKVSYSQLEAAMKTPEDDNSPERTEKDLLEDILSSVRSLSAEISEIKQNQEPSGFSSLYTLPDAHASGVEETPASRKTRELLADIMASGVTINPAYRVTAKPSDSTE